MPLILLKCFCLIVEYLFAAQECDANEVEQTPTVGYPIKKVIV